MGVVISYCVFGAEVNTLSVFVTKVLSYSVLSGAEVVSYSVYRAEVVSYSVFAAEVNTVSVFVTKILSNSVSGAEVVSYSVFGAEVREVVKIPEWE
jgi:hypothetical protein